MTTAENYKQKIKFDGNTIETTVARRADQVTQWLVDNVTELGEDKPTYVGLAVEWKHTSNKAATLQLCIKNKCLLIQLMYMDFFPYSLKSALNNPNFILLGLDIKARTDKLRDYYLKCAKTIDIKELASERWPGKFSDKSCLKDISRWVRGLEIPDVEYLKMSDWEARFLSVEQIEYATINAYASLIVGYHMVKK